MYPDKPALFTHIIGIIAV